MATDYDLRILLSAEDRITGTLNNVRSALGGLTGSANGAAEAIQHFVAVGIRIYSVYEVVHTIRNGFNELGEAVLGFQDKMTQIAALTGAGTKDLKDLGAGIIDISMQTGRSATEMGQALFFIESHGYRGADALTILGEAAKLASAGLGTTDQIVRVVTGQMIAYGAAASEATHFMDVFAKTEQQAALPIGELSQQMARVTPLAAALRIPIEQVGAAIATISQTGLSSSRTMTDFIAVLNQLVQANPQQVKALEAIGYPIDQLRKDLAEQGMIQALRNLYQHAGGDLDALGKVLGDRTRSLVGFLAAMRDGGKDADLVLQELQKSAGTTARVFELSQERITLQWQRMTATLQAYGIVLTQELLPGVAAWLRQINDAAQQGDLIKAWDSFFQGLSTIPQTVGDTIGRLGEQMFGAGFNIVEQLASGIIDGANTILQSAVNYVADLIAGFLIGASPPPKGPLSYLREGADRWTRDYAQRIESNGQIMAQAAEHVAGQVNDALGQIGAARGGNLDQIKAAISDIDQQLLPWKLAADSVKDSYESQINPLERQIALLRDIKDQEYERQKLVFQRTDMELRALEMQAEGDPVRRAQLAGQMVAAQFSARQHSINAEIASINRQMREPRRRGETAAEYNERRQALMDRQRVLNLERQQEALRNPQLLAQIAQRRELLKYDEAGAKLAHDKFEYERDAAILPLAQKRDELKYKMQQELDLIKQQTDGLEDQRKILERQRQELERIAGARRGAGGGVGAHPWQLPAAPSAHDVDEANRRRIDEAANMLTGRLQTAIDTWMIRRGPAIGQGIVGAIAGNMVFGPIGAVIGAKFVPELMAELNRRGVGPDEWTTFATNLRNGLTSAWDRVGGRLKVGDIVGAANEAFDIGKEWGQSFEKGFFSTWYTVTTKGTAAVGYRPLTGADTQRAGFLEANMANVITDTIESTRVTQDANEPGAVRRTGLGRTIIEAMFGQQEALNFEVARDLIDKNVVQPVQNALRSAWASMWAPTVTEGAGGMPMLGPSPIQQIFENLPTQITEALRSVKGAGINLIDLIFNVLPSADQRAAGNKTIAAYVQREDVQGMMTQLGETLGGIVGRGLAQAILKLAAPADESVQERNAAIGLLAVRFVTRFIDEVADQLGGKSVRDKFNNAVNGLLGGQTQEQQDAAARVKQGATAAALQTPMGAIAGGLYYAWQWVSTNLPETLSAVTKAIETMIDNIKYLIIEPFDTWFRDKWGVLWHFVTVTLENEMITASHTLGLYMNTIKANFLSAFGGQEGAQGSLNQAIVGFGVTFTGVVTTMGAEYVWQPLLNKITEFKRALTDPEIAAAIRRLDQLNRARPPAPPPPPEGGGFGPGNQNATGGLYVIGGSGGTDSQHRDMWFTPGETVAIIPPGQSGSPAIEKAQRESYGGDININAPLIQADKIDNDTDLDAMLDRVRAFLVEDIRAARGQGVQRPQGITPRGAR